MENKRMKKAKKKDKGVEEKVEKRDKRGRYTKGTGGGPGRKKGDPKDLVCGDGKKRSVSVLLDDLLKAYASMGGEKFIKKWALESKGNLKKFIEILFKFAPQPENPSLPGGTTFEISEKFMPKIKLERIYTDIRPNENTIMKRPRPGDARKKRIMELQDKLKEKDEELRRLKALIDGHDTKEIEHEPIRPIELPEHSKAEKQSKDSTNQKSKQESGDE